MNENFETPIHAEESAWYVDLTREEAAAYALLMA